MFMTATWNNLISLSFVVAMGGTLLSTVAFYVTYKIRERKNKARRQIAAQPSMEAARVERPKIRFG